MHHLACVLHPRERGLTPYRVAFRRAESPPVPSMRDDGLWYTHPERDETAIVCRRQKITGRCWLCDRRRIHSLMMLHNTKIGHLFIYSS